MVTELKTWLFQCDKCKYAHTEKAVSCPDVPKEWLMIARKEETHMDFPLVECRYHFCHSCRKFTDAELLEVLPKYTQKRCYIVRTVVG